ALVDAGHHAGGVDDVEGIVPQMQATPGMPERKAVARRHERVRQILHTLPESAQAAILESYDQEEAAHVAAAVPAGYDGRDDDTQVIPVYREEFDQQYGQK
ncbi:ABC transporter ATP-binding protein, partial [Rhodococcus sp. NPDC003383]